MTGTFTMQWSPLVSSLGCVNNALVRATVGVGCVKFWDFSVSLTGGGGYSPALCMLDRAPRVLENPLGEEGCVILPMFLWGGRGGSLHAADYCLKWGAGRLFEICPAP